MKVKMKCNDNDVIMKWPWKLEWNDDENWNCGWLGGFSPIKKKLLIT